MAIDTREKRQAAAVISHYFMGPNVTPNATPDVEWRQEAAWGYPGILPTGVVAGVDGTQQHIFMRRGHRRGIGGMNMCW